MRLLNGACPQGGLLRFHLIDGLRADSGDLRPVAVGLFARGANTDPATVLGQAVVTVLVGKPDAVQDAFSSRAGVRDRARAVLFQTYMRQRKERERAGTYLLLVYGDLARFARLDPSGVVASSPFLWRGKDFGTVLCRAMDAICRAPPDLLGLHSQIRRPDARASDVARIALERMYPGKPWTVEGMAEVSFCGESYIGNSRSCPKTFGRGTTAYPVYAFSEGRVMFLKEQWVSPSTDSPREGDTYRKLEKYGIANVPRLHAEGPVTDSLGQPQCTVVSGMVSDQDLYEDVRPLEWYRIVLSDVGRPLSAFRSSKQLVLALRDAVQGTQGFAGFGSKRY